MVDDLTADPNNPGSTRKTYTFNTYDNLDDVIDVTRYYDRANTEGLPDNAPNAGDPVIGRSGAAYDNLGQPIPVDQLQPERHRGHRLQHLVRRATAT